MSADLEQAESRYMSGPKADAILAHAGVKKKRKRPKNEDYIGGSATPEASGGGLLLRDEDEWKSRRKRSELDGEDAPGEIH